MSSFKVTGFDKIENRLEQMKKGAEELGKTKSVSFKKLFTVSFMRKYTSFSSFKELLEAGDFEVESQEDFEDLVDEEFDSYIAANTKFKNWGDMLSNATSQYISKKLGF